MSSDCKDFLTKILIKDPKERLGSKNGVQEILEHPWFKDLDPQKMLLRKIKPSFIPKLSKNMLDLRFFDDEFTE